VQNFEVAALKIVKGWLPEESLVTVPTVHLLDDAANVIVMDDCGEQAVTLKALMIGNTPPLSVAKEIGTALGNFLGHLHAWGSGNQSLIDIFNTNMAGKQLSAFATYGRLISTLSGEDNLPALSDPTLDVTKDRMETISRLASERMSAMTSSLGTFVMGDFWPGNIMVTLSGGCVERIYVVDWEVARTGLVGLDIGQLCAEMYLLGRFHPSCRESAFGTMESFLTSYKHTQDVEDSVLRMALSHIGAHLIAWTPRSRWGRKETTREVVVEGVEMIAGDINIVWDKLRLNCYRI
jgi:hypothetical protein